MHFFPQQELLFLQCKGQQASQCGGCREKVHLRHQEPAQVKGRGGGKSKDMSKKAILMSGPPGIGKTSSAMIISRSALIPSSNGLKSWFPAGHCVCRAHDAQWTSAVLRWAPSHASGCSPC